MRGWYHLFTRRCSVFISGQIRKQYTDVAFSLHLLSSCDSRSYIWYVCISTPGTPGINGYIHMHGYTSRARMDAMNTGVRV